MTTRNVTNSEFTSYPATTTTLPSGRQLTHAYDALYRRSQVKETSGGANIASWQFFGPSRVAEVTLGNGLICSWMNNARTHGAVQPSVANPGWGNQSSDRLGYDGAGRPITKRYLSGGVDGTTHAYSNPSSVVGFTTEYDLASNKFYERELHCESRSHLYEPFTNGLPGGGYDSLDRLRQYQRGTLASTGGFGGNGGGSIATAIGLPNTDTQRTYDLDGLGNWRRTNFTLVPSSGPNQVVAEVRQHSGLNEITRLHDTNSVTGTSQTDLAYDGVAGASNGNLKNDGTRGYVWDALNRLISVYKDPNTSPVLIASYSYDALNRRIRKVVSDLGGGLGGLTGDIPAGTTNCVYRGWRCVEERDVSNTLTVQYVWGIYLDELLQQKTYVNTGSQPLAAGTYYLLQDLLYRTTALTSSSANIVEAYDTDAYGNTLIFKAAGTGGNWWADNTVSTRYPACSFIFTGQRFDPETTIYYFKRRYYAQMLGRFTSRDPIDGLTPLYDFTGDNPVTRFDQYGMMWDDCWVERAATFPKGVSRAKRNISCFIRCECVPNLAENPTEYEIPLSGPPGTDAENELRCWGGPLLVALLSGECPDEGDDCLKPTPKPSPKPTPTPIPVVPPRRYLTPKQEQALNPQINYDTLPSQNNANPLKVFPDNSPKIPWYDKFIILIQ